MKKIICLLIICSLSIFSMTSCKANGEGNEVFDTLGEITDEELYRDATTLRFNILKFGKQNGQDLTWYLVESYKDYRVLLCEKVLDFIPYNDGVDVNYEDSSIYRYMENDFVSQYFSDQEKKQLLSFTDGLKVTLPTLDNLKEYFGEVNKTQPGYYGNKEYYSPNKEMTAKPSESSQNEALVNNPFDNYLYATHNNLELDARYNFADGCQPYWIYDGNELYANYVTATGYVARTSQNNQYIGFRPIIKVRK